MPRIITLVQEGCGACEDAKIALAPLVEAGEVEIMDVTKDPEAMLLAAAHDIDLFPAAFVMLSDGSLFGQVCDITTSDDVEEEEEAPSD